MPELTEAALRNLASGATSGAGTHVCGACKGEKESVRINSRLCRACAGIGASPSTPSVADLLARIERLEERADKQAAAIRDLRKYKHEH